MYLQALFTLLFFSLTITQKVSNDAVKNYSEFFNFGKKKSYEKIDREKYENSVIKSKVDILGDVFKQSIAIIKSKNIMDLVFLIDASSTVGQYNFHSELKFVKKLLSDVTVDFNHTRVAVITFSSQGNIIKNIDEITHPRIENNKCLLLNKEINNITYTGGGTYTLGAFKAAQEILQNSRLNAEKVIILITDGYSNGGDPIPIANELKQSQVTIFTIGISNGNVKELYEIATSPGELHSYLLDSFEEFENLARRALHVDLQSGDYYPLGITKPCDNLCESPPCCDAKAYCTCGTSTGQYSCLCELGYYGSGLNNSCLPCPSGSYATGPNLCLPCPDIHHFTKAPAIGMESCTCKIGYKNNENSSCEIISCPKHPILLNGYFVKKKECSTVLNSACGVRCNVGYTLSGSSIRLCQQDGTWSGQTPTCQVKTCPRLPIPIHGGMNCKHSDLKENFTSTDSNLPVDTTCSFQCERGYTLIGSHSRTCLPLAQWDGLRSACKQVKCNKLSKINFGTVEPKSCTIGKQPHGKQCKFTCLEGFDLSGGQTKTCSDGSWDNKDELICKDVTKPDLKCPSNVIETTLNGKPYGLVSWPVPTANDNSGLNVTIWSIPVVKGTFKFKIGVNHVTYYAIDGSHNKAKCTFNVTIIDNEPPTIESCVDPPIFISSGPANISWDEPNIFDNSHHVQIIKSLEFGVFPIGTTQVIYKAVDNSNNTNTCILNITVEEPKCPILPAPIYGDKQCNTTDNKTQCVVTCHEGYAFPIVEEFPSTINDETLKYFCNEKDAIWSNTANLTTPECTISEVPLDFKQTGAVEINNETNDVCEDLRKLEKIRQDVQKSLEQNTLETCADCEIITQPECEVNEISNLIKREATNSTDTKRKKKKLNIQFEIRTKNKNRKKNRNKNGVFNNGLIGNYNVSVNPPIINCPVGSYKRKLRCINCPRGTFHNITSNICQSCDIGYYNDKFGQEICKLCPENYSTRKLHAKSNSDCIAKCSPGTFAHKKQIKHPKNHQKSIIERITLQPYCSSCPLGTYQPFYGQTTCILCPTNTTTTKRGAKTISECENSLHPCHANPCINGVCSADGDYGYTCKCRENYIGSNCDIFINPCNSQPCQNDGICLFNKTLDTLDTFMCSCPEGYFGSTCALVKTDCELPCQNNASCVMTEDDESICLCPAGYGGKLCEEKIERCKYNLCENNSTCIELPEEYKCICQSGYLGRRCQYVPCDFQPCKGNKICINENVKMATRHDYKCICPEGYTGANCTIMIDYCINNPCLNNGECKSIFGSYACFCPKGFSGDNCEITLINNYILNFPRSGVTDFVQVNGANVDLTELTLCFWVITNDNFNYGTILSYATHEFFNSLTITDYTGVVIYINNKHIVTDILLNDDKWHHFCFTWENQHGSYQIYLDSNLVINGTNFATAEIIKGKGKLILGQEQDNFGGQFSQSESFLGKLAHVDIYDKALDTDKVKEIMNSCNLASQGNVYAWSEFAQNTRGDVTIETSTFCRKCERPPAPNFSTVLVINNLALYSCNVGYKLTNFHKGRKCTKAALWESEDPQCIPINCGNPGYIENGYFKGNSFTYNSTIMYKCNKGYNLTGESQSRTCKDDGIWHPDEPKCNKLVCPKFKINKKAKVIVHQPEEDTEDINFNKIDNFTVGTEIDISCGDESEKTMTCMQNGSWDSSPPECKGNYKLPCNIEHIPSAPDNGYMDEDSYNQVLEGLSDKVYYICRRGYKQMNENSSICIPDGYWSELKMECKVITCKEPKNLSQFGFKIQEGEAKVYEVGHMVRYSCVEGYSTRGQPIARCMNTGVWSKINGLCIRQACGKPSLSPEIKILTTNPAYINNAEIQIQCPNNKLLNLKCIDGKWRGGSC